MASVLIQTVGCLVCSNIGAVFSQSCCSQTQSKDQRLKTIKHQSLPACGKTDEAPRFGFSLSHIVSFEFTVRKKGVTETTEHIPADKKQFLNLPDW